MDLIDPVRQRLADAVRSRVVGPGADARGAELFDAPGERWFADDAVIRVVHADASMFIGGLRALLLQTLHPLAMAGVAQHSDYRGDPWGRLQRTADFLAATTYGPADEAQRAVDTVRRVHTRVTGTARDGRPYSANDPHLLEWVHCVEVDSFLSAYRRYGATHLSDDEADEYVRDMAVIARALGVVDPPTTTVALASRLRAYRRELRSTPEAREAVRYLVVSAPLPLPARPAYGILAAAAVGLMPVWARLPLLLPWLPVSERAVVQPAGQALVRTLRWALAPDSPQR
ncbi:MAG: oxygenase MpaB family protein [Ilumatobacteraceae bacterium]